jgi:predicted carbohydrate-binding protein with CBM5 and CBM33 domain
MSRSSIGRRFAPRTLAMAGAAVTILAALLALAAVRSPRASAHGSTVNPPARTYRCWERWGSQFQNPAMATEDPMCWQAWQANPNAMWNWNGLYREEVAGRHEAVIPDGQLCSGGHAVGGQYNAMDAVGDWKATDLANDFTVTLDDQAHHGSDYLKIYVTRQGFDPLTQPLRWSDLELVKETPKLAPGVAAGSSGSYKDDQHGVPVSVDVSAPGRTGRHIVYTIWQASHKDQSFYFCSDVNFTGGPSAPGPRPTTTSAPTTTTVAPWPGRTTTTTKAPPPVPPVTGTGGCAATYRTVSAWPGGYQGEVAVAAGAAPTSGWSVSWANPAGTTVDNAWNATVTAAAGTVTATSAAWNGSLGAGASTSFGFLGSGTPPDAPALTCSAH